jgi:dihydroflavonol-4-reductase
MTVVVTGAAGHLGGNLVRALLSQRRKVRALVHRGRRALAGLDVEFCEGDVCDAVSLRRVFQGADVVYHTAAHVSIVGDEWALLEKTNIAGTRNILEAVQACGVRRLVHFSSIHALEQEPLDETLDESRPLATSMRVAPYDRSKAMGDAEVRRAVEQGLNAIILYPTAIIGPYDWRPSHVGDVLLALCCQRMPALVSSGFDWVDVRDVAEGAIHAEHVAAPGALYLLSGHWVSVKDLASQVQEITGVGVPRLVAPLGLARLAAPLVTWYNRYRGSRPLFTSVALQALESNRYISHARATAEFGYRPRPFHDTLADTLHWFAQEGYLPGLPRPWRSDG